MKVELDILETCEAVSNILRKLEDVDYTCSCLLVVWIVAEIAITVSFNKLYNSIFKTCKKIHQGRNVSDDSKMLHFK